MQVGVDTRDGHAVDRRVAGADQADLARVVAVSASATTVTSFRREPGATGVARMSGLASAMTRPDGSAITR